MSRTNFKFQQFQFILRIIFNNMNRTPRRTKSYLFIRIHLKLRSGLEIKRFFFSFLTNISKTIFFVFSLSSFHIPFDIETLEYGAIFGNFISYDTLKFEVKQYHRSQQIMEINY